MTLKRLAIAVAILAAAAVFLATYSGWSDAALHAFKPKTVRPKAPAGSPEALSILAGSFDAELEFRRDGSTPLTGSAIETREVTADGRWLVRRLSGTLDGKPFEAIGLVGFDTQRGRFTGTWTDTRLGALVLFDAAYSPENLRMAGTFRPAASYGTGQLSRFEEALTQDGAGTLEISETTAGGPSVVALRIVYSPRG